MNKLCLWKNCPDQANEQEIAWHFVGPHRLSCNQAARFLAIKRGKGLQFFLVKTCDRLRISMQAGLGNRREKIRLPQALHIGMVRQQSFDQRGSRTRHPDYKYRSIVIRTIAFARRVAGAGNTVDPGAVLLCIESRD